MVKRIGFGCFLIVLLLGCSGVAGASYLLWTSQGARLVVAVALRYALGPSQVTLGDLTGTLATGWSLKGCELSQADRLPPGTVVNLQRLEAGPLSLARLSSFRLQASQVRVHVPTLATVVTVDRLEGDLESGVSLHRVRVEGFRRLPLGTHLSLQRLDASWPLRLANLHTIHNGKLQFPDADPIVFSSAQQGGQATAWIYAKTVTVSQLRGLFPDREALKPFSGALADVDLTVTGSRSDPTIVGTFAVTQLARRGFVLTHAPGTLAVRLSGVPDRLSATGHVALRRGTLVAKETRIALEPSQVRFSGDMRRPAFDVKGRSTVDGTRIAIALTGTFDSPTLTLSSYPPMAQERLLLMLATGKSWKGAQETLAHGAISSELATDFLDYLFLDGAGNHLAKRLGISALAVTHDAQTNMVGVQTTFADRVTVNMEMDPAASTPDQPPPDADRSATPAIRSSPAPGPYKLGAEYRLTDSSSLRVEGERTIRSLGGQADQTSQLGQTTVRSQTNDTVLLKFKRRF